METLADSQQGLVAFASEFLATQAFLLKFYYCSHWKFTSQDMQLPLPI